MRVTVLGCGSSSGVPEIGCTCKVCTSDNPKNARTRVSLYIEVDETCFLIDSSPDLRMQALRHDIRRVDAVLYTHDHADHVNGMDDLRGFNKLSHEEVQIYGSRETLKSVQQRFPYPFFPKLDKLWYRPSLIAHELADEAILHSTIAGVEVTAFQQIHGKIKTLGYRIGNFAYSTDCNELPETAFEALAGTEVWVVDCLRYDPSYTHSHLELTLGWIERVKPRLTILTHMAHDFDYETLLQELPAGVVPGYDGLVIEM